MAIKYCYGESGEYGGTEVYNILAIGQNFTFSIADAYGSNRGKFYLYVRWSLPAVDIENDFNYFKEVFSRSSVTIQYSQF